MAAGNDPNFTNGAPPPDQYIPLSPARETRRSARWPSTGCLMAALIGLIALCLVGIVAVAVLGMFWFRSTAVVSAPATLTGEATEIVLLTTTSTFTAAPSIPPTQAVLATLTPVPTNTLSLTQPASPTLPLQVTATPTPKPTWLPCPGSYHSRLYVGDVAYVSFEPPLPNRVRSQPNTASVVLGMLQPGERMDIIGGPVCSNQWIWWQIRSQATGLTGWTTEGDAKSYWLVPVP